MLCAALLNNSKKASSFGIKPNMIVPLCGPRSARSPAHRCLPPDETGRPRQSAAETSEHHEVMRSYLSRADGGVQRDRQRRRRGIAKPLDDRRNAVTGNREA